MCKNSLRLTKLAKCAIAVLAVSVILAQSILCVLAEIETPANRLTAEHLKAYYNFEDVNQMGKDVSGNNNNMVTPWGYPVTQVATTSSASLNLGNGGKFSAQSVLVPEGWAYGQNDYLDNLDTYTLSMFFQNTTAGVGGTLFNNKYWGESGVQVTVNKWPDASATGQMELYLDYNYVDTAGATQTHHACVKFIPDASGSVDQSWHHIALTVDKANKSLKFYFNGELVHQSGNVQALAVDTDKYSIAFGAMFDTTYSNCASAFDGALDEIRVYNFAATSEEVIKLSQNDLTVSDDDDEPIAPVNRLDNERLAAYYDFEDGNIIGKDVSGNDRYLTVGWGYHPAQIESNSGELNLGKAGKFAAQSAMMPSGSAYNENDFLDDMEAYTISMFFQNTEAGTGGILFNNKYWGEGGVRVSVNKWPDPSATGQVEMYFDYNYIDTAGIEQNFRQPVKLIPDVSGNIDQSWQHIAVAVDKTAKTIKLYHNGVLIHENGDVQSLVVDSQKYPLAFGALLDPQWPDVNSPFDGALDEIRIYDFAINAHEATILSENGVSAAGDATMGNTPITDKYDLYTYTLPYWEGDTVYNESVLVLKGEDGSVPVKSLMYSATEILEVRSQDLKTVYAEGTDYIIKDGKLTFPSGSTIPMMEYSEYYPDTFTSGSTFNDTFGNNIYLSEDLQKKQISVTYKHNGKWDGVVPSYQGRYIPKTIQKLKDKEELNIVFYGDSITQGYSASGFFGFAPYADSWASMTGAVLRAKYGYNDINVINSALAGTDTVWGSDDANLTPRVISNNPDLVVIAFGMNDCNRSTASYRANIKAMIEKVRAVNPDTEFLLVSSMLPHPTISGNHGIYQNELLALQQELSGVAVARATDAFRSLVKNKDYYDVSANNYNHPNDFTIRLYAQTVIASLYGNIDTSALVDIISKAERLDLSMYTPNSWNKLEAVLAQVRPLIDSAEQSDIDEGVKTLKSAIDHLVEVDRITNENLIAYYSFEYGNDIGWDTSSKGNHIETGFWGDVVTQFPSGEPLNGSSGRFMGASIAVPKFRDFNQKDYLDLADNYTLSFFFKMASNSKGGTLFNNKNWANEGIKISTHTWEDPTAVGQVEIFLTFAYRDRNGQLRNVHQVVHFMPEAQDGGVDTSWHHITLSVNKEKGVSFYFDGEEKNISLPTDISELVLDCEKYTMSFGGSYDDEYLNAQECFNGCLDEIRVYSFAASAGEAKRLYMNTDLPTPEPKQDNESEDNNIILKAETKSGLSVELTVPKAAVPTDVEFKAEDIHSGDVYNKLKEILGERIDSAICFNLIMFDGNTPIVSLKDYSHIILKGISDWDGYTLCFLNEDGKLEKLEHFIDSDKFNTYSKTLGAFVLLKERDEAPVVDDSIKIPATSDIFAIDAVFTLLFSSLAIMILYKKREHGETTQNNEGVDMP